MEEIIKKIVVNLKKDKKIYNSRFEDIEDELYLEKTKNLLNECIMEEDELSFRFLKLKVKDQNPKSCCKPLIKCEMKPFVDNLALKIENVELKSQNLRLSSQNIKNSIKTLKNFIEKRELYYSDDDNEID